MMSEEKGDSKTPFNQLKLVNLYEMNNNLDAS